MFRRLIASYAPAEQLARTLDLFRANPMHLQALIEAAYYLRTNEEGAELGGPQRRDALNDLPPFVWALLENFIGANGNAQVVGRGNVLWDHLIYAYLVENTRVLEVFQKVIYEYVHGEKLGTPIDSDSLAWLRNTEVLFFSTANQFSILNTVSSIRPDKQATRRNNYFRMFGMDLNHGTADGNAYPYRRADASNKEFVDTFEKFLQEVWVGISNFGNSSGINRTDASAIANLARQLNIMLLARRQNGNLSREEFAHVALLSWFHLTLEVQNNAPIIQSLRANSSNADQRLFKVAEKVGVKAHAKTYDFLQLADPMSRLLIQIEDGDFNNVANVPALYQPGVLEDDMRTIITHWSIATGRDMKVQRGKNLTVVSNN
ncbi:MAG: hypothetical protein AAF927_08700 [Bacteroidota bacterium]